MDNFKNFLNTSFDKAINLKIAFKKLEEKEWDSITVLNELNVQLGHVYNIYNHDQEITENHRLINNLGDELSDVLLQLSYLSYLEKIDFNNLEKYSNYSYSKIDGLSILFGQLTESLLEKYDYRFKKQHDNFPNVDDFIKDRIIKMFLIVFNIGEKENIDLIKEFDDMYIDASNFIERKTQNGNA